MAKYKKVGPHSYCEKEDEFGTEEGPGYPEDNKGCLGGVATVILCLVVLLVV